MKKVTKPAIKCDSCKQTIKYEEYEEFCDQCQKLIAEKSYPLQMTVFERGADHSYHVELCSWKCVKAYLKQHQKKLVKTEFVVFPYLTFDLHRGKGYAESGRDFFKVFMGEVEA